LITQSKEGADSGMQILLAHIDALALSLDRTRGLFNTLSSSMDSDIKAFSNAIYSQFFKWINDVSEPLKKLRQQVDARTITPDMAWPEFTKLQNESSRIFAQCLDFLGGIAVRKMQLEEGTCALAEVLISQLRTSNKWASVLILGEERSFDEVSIKTQIIRLRFPDWETWSLPLAAYELGMLVAVGEAREIMNDLLHAEQAGLRALIKDPLEESAEKTLAGPVRAVRQRFQEGAKPEDVEEFISDQEGPMRILFADAFATYFLGPAYVYARVYRRFAPGEVLNAGRGQPPLAMRMVLMLGVLRGMSEEASPDPEYDPGPYEEVRSRLTALWNQTVQGTGVQADLDSLQFGTPFDAWFSLIYDRLSQPNRLLGFSAAEWAAAQTLGNRLLDLDESELKVPRSLATILNAAWECRNKNPNRLETIDRMVRVLGRYSQPYVAAASGSIARPQQSQPALLTDTDLARATPASPPTSNGIFGLGG
jgi:hypothetical protein